MLILITLTLIKLIQGDTHTHSGLAMAKGKNSELNYLMSIKKKVKLATVYNLGDNR